jgi:hypothetical protein
LKVTPFVVRESGRELLRIRPAGGGAGLVGYHLALLGLGGPGPAARAAALAAHLDAALQAAAADPADRAVLLGAITPLRRRLAEFDDGPARSGPCLSGSFPSRSRRP